MTKTFYVDFNSIVIEAEDKEQAYQMAKDIIEEDGDYILNDYEVNEE